MPPTCIMYTTCMAFHQFADAAYMAFHQFAAAQAALSEYKCAAVSAGIQLPAYLQQLSLEIMLQQGQLSQVGGAG